MEYYLIKGGRQEGPFPSEELASHDVRPDTRVWREGLADWVEAGTLEELGWLFVSDKSAATLPPPIVDKEYFAVINGNQVGPKSVADLKSLGVGKDTMVWCEGMSDWQRADTVEDFRRVFAPSVPPYMGSQPDNAYLQGMRRSGWQGWAIASGIVNFLTMWVVWFPAIGLVFSILGLVFNNDANTKYAAGFPELGERAESQAKTMTIVSLVIAGIALLGALATVAFGIALLGTLV